MKTKKLIAPIIITVVLVCLLLLYLIVFALVPGPIAMRVIGIAVFLALIGVSVFVLVERIKEVRSGEEDDLSQY